jgi:hypothetical protein
MVCPNKISSRNGGKSEVESSIRHLRYQVRHWSKTLGRIFPVQSVWRWLSSLGMKSLENTPRKTPCINPHSLSPEMTPMWESCYFR